jgi:hypothetical protein
MADPDGRISGSHDELAHGRGRLICTHHEASAGLLHELGTVKA